jgi:hypothetical protein
MLFLQLGSVNLSHNSTVDPAPRSSRLRIENDNDDEDDWSRRQDDLWDKYHRLHRVLRASSPHRQSPFRNRELRFGIPLLQLLNSCNF